MCVFLSQITSSSDRICLVTLLYPQKFVPLCKNRLCDTHSLITGPWATKAPVTLIMLYCDQNTLLWYIKIYIFCIEITWRLVLDIIPKRFITFLQNQTEQPCWQKTLPDAIPPLAKFHLMRQNHGNFCTNAAI